MLGITVPDFSEARGPRRRIGAVRRVLHEKTRSCVGVRPSVLLFPRGTLSFTWAEWGDDSEFFLDGALSDGVHPVLSVPVATVLSET